MLVSADSPAPGDESSAEKDARSCVCAFPAGFPGNSIGSAVCVVYIGLNDHPFANLIIESSRTRVKTTYVMSPSIEGVRLEMHYE